MLKLKLQYFGHLMQRTDSLGKTLMLGMIEGRKKIGWQRMRWLDGITDSLWPHGLQHTRLGCPSLSPGVCSVSCPLSQWYHPTILFSVTLLLLLPSVFPIIRVFSSDGLFASGDPSIGASASASALPINNHGWFPLGLTGWISLKSKGLSRVFSNTTVQTMKAALQMIVLWSRSFIQRNIHTWILL